MVFFILRSYYNINKSQQLHKILPVKSIIGKSVKKL